MRRLCGTSIADSTLFLDGLEQNTGHDDHDDQENTPADDGKMPKHQQPPQKNELLRNEFPSFQDLS